MNGKYRNEFLESGRTVGGFEYVVLGTNNTLSKKYCQKRQYENPCGHRSESFKCRRYRRHWLKYTKI